MNHCRQLNHLIHSSRSFTSNSSVKCLGVVGAGQMGSGIAYVSALNAQIPKVLLMDNNPTQLSKGLQYIESILNKRVDKKSLNSTDRDACMARIVPTTSLDTFDNTEVVIEAVNEIVDLKREILTALDKITTPETILASNTSSISITSLGSATTRPERIIGMHFMNPVPHMPLVELIPSLLTSSSTLTSIQVLAKQMGKQTTTSKDVPGFIANRILMPYINEAVHAFNEGIASKEDIDSTMTLGTNVPMGPLKLADFIGLDTCLAIMHVLRKQLGSDKYHPCALLQTYVNAGFLGVKTKRGFYTY